MTEKAKPTKKPAISMAESTIAEKAPKKRIAKPVLKKPAKAAATTLLKPVKVEKPAKAVKAAKALKQDKPRKTKMVSTRFTMPANEYAQLVEFKKICLKAGVPVKKSELLRAGLLNLSKLSAVELIAAVVQVAQLKANKPAKS